MFSVFLSWSFGLGGAFSLKDPVLRLLISQDGSSAQRIQTLIENTEPEANGECFFLAFPRVFLGFPRVFR